MATGIIKHSGCVKLLEARNISSTEVTSYACDWSNYDLLIICAMFYANINETIVVPNSYFSETGPGFRVIINNVESVNNVERGRRYNVYRNGNNAVYISAEQSEAELYGIQIYGVKIS